ncbi:hypothetical protein FRC07_014531 [Ceratobasidium sp. 392]|nr:hypothetical protein FRC07_014531 [Ceratobasidium sp. 392]
MIHGSRSMSALSSSAQSRPVPAPRRPHSNTITGERPAASAPRSKMLVTSPPHSPRHIQNHLYQMFLEGQTADVSVVIRGSWEALYKLHRVILIQSDYFRTLFTNGFLESSRSYRSAADSTSGDVIELHFDDPNITRPAFEICIARLYGGGPDLFVEPGLIPSNQHPLTQSFPIACPPSSAPDGSHPATPRFLLSLLATATFLHIPSVTTQALLLVLSTIGPWTISRYFGFAIGQGVGEPEGDEPQSAAGLNAIGRPAPAVAPKVSPSKPPRIDEVSPQEEDEEDDLVKVSSLGTHEGHLPKDRIASGVSQLTLDDTRSVYTEYGEDNSPMYFYGVVGDKIGEACACWLARWGADLLVLEEAVEARLFPPTNSAPKFAVPFPALVHKRSTSNPSATPPSPTFSPFSASLTLHNASHSSSSLPSSSRRPTTSYIHPTLLAPAILRPGSTSSSGPVKAPTVWSHNGLGARWAHAVICSDDLFVRGEWERFVFATRVVELRRRQLERELVAAKDDVAATKKIEQLKRAEEREWDELFRTGIYYSHISLEDLHKISQEPSSTGKPYVDVTTLQSAHWRQSILRSQITSRSVVAPSRPSSPTPIGIGSSSSQGSTTEGELGGLVTTSELLAAPYIDDTKFYYPVPCDASVRIGHDRTAIASEADGLSLADMDVLASISSPGKVRKPATERDFFGLRPSRRTAKEIAEEHKQGSEVVKWSANEPFRFSVEFWGLDTLKEKNRLHSQTIWYAGSLYNVYVQVIKKKGLQLGIQSAVDPIPPASAPASFVLLNNPSSSPAEITSPLLYPSPQFALSPLQRGLSLPGTGPITSPPTPSPRTGTTPPDRDAPVTSPPHAPVAPWRDPRPVVRSYFVMSCPSLIGSSLTRFQSGPDDFKISQSWGWKSSCLWSEPESEDPPAVEDDLINSLRATVMIGVV